MFDTQLMKKVLIHSLFTHYCVQLLLAVLNTCQDGAELIVRVGRQRLLQNRFVFLGVCGDAKSRLQNVDWMRQCFSFAWIWASATCIAFFAVRQAMRAGVGRGGASWQFEVRELREDMPIQQKCLES